jgi:hypothetical protein
MGEVAAAVPDLAGGAARRAEAALAPRRPQARCDTENLRAEWAGLMGSLAEARSNARDS